MFNFMAAGRLPPVCEMKVSIFLIQDILFVAGMSHYIISHVFLIIGHSSIANSIILQLRIDASL